MWCVPHPSKPGEQIYSLSNECVSLFVCCSFVITFWTFLNSKLHLIIRMRRKILVYPTIVLKHVICQRDITMDLHGNSVTVLVCLEEECRNHGSQSTLESLVESHCVTTVTTVTVVTMVTMCNTGSSRLCQ